MVAGVAVDDVEVVNLLEVVLGGTCGVHTTHSWVEAATQNCCESCLLKTLSVGPLPAVLEMCLVERLIVGSVEVVDTTFQAGIHDGKVLIGQCHIDDQLGLMTLEQSHQLLNAVGVDFVGCDVRSTNSLSHGVTFLFVSRSDHNFVKHVGIFGALVCYYGSHTATANDDYFVHNV